MCRAAVSSPLSLTFDYGEDHVFVTIPLVKYVQLEMWLHEFYKIIDIYIR